MIKKIRRVLKNDFYKNVLTLVSGTLLSQIIPIIVSPILTRLYSPKEFGLYATIFSLSAILSTVVTGKYELAIMLPDCKKKAINIFVFTILLTISISFLTLIMVFLSFEFLQKYTTIQELKQWLFSIPIILFLIGVFNVLTLWHNRTKKFQAIALSKILKNVSTAILSVLFGYFNFGFKGLILGLVLGYLISYFAFVKSTFFDFKKYFHDIKLNVFKDQAIKYKDFFFINTPASLINSASVNAPLLLLDYYFSPIIVGCYSLSQRVLQAPMGVLGGSVAQVFFQKISEEKDEYKIKKMTLDIYYKLLKIGVLPLSLVCFFGGDLFSFFFGSEWYNAGRYSQVLSPWIFLVFISSPLSNIMTVKELHKHNLFFNIVLLLSRVMVIVLGAIYLKDAYITIAWFGFIGFIIWLIFIAYLLSIVKANLKQVLIKTIKIILKFIFPMVLLWSITKI